MEMHIFTTLCILVLMSAPNMIQSLQQCSCMNDIWDCSFRVKSIILSEEVCSAKKWLLHHNNLKAIPTPLRYMDVIDVSYNLLGLIERPIYFGQTVNYLDLSSNCLQSLEILYRNDILTLVANDNEISNLDFPEMLYIRNELILARNKITSIPPSSFPRSLTYIDLSGNPISTISKEAFQQLSNLQVLHLNSTQTLSELEDGTFGGLVSLKILSLNNNKLTDLAEDLFSSLENLEALFLHENELSELPLGIFRNLYRLRLLNLDNNLLTELPEELFSRLHSLEDLSVRSNSLKTLPVLRLCTGPISTVTFADNLIESVDEADVRELLRDGFLNADLSDNDVSDDSLTWIDDAEDIVLRYPSIDCRKIQMSKVTNHGYISYCVNGSVPTNDNNDYSYEVFDSGSR